MNIHPSKASLQYSALHPAGPAVKLSSIRPRRPEWLGLMAGMGATVRVRGRDARWLSRADCGHSCPAGQDDPGTPR